MNHNELKANLLKSYTERYGREPKDTFDYMSENEKTYFKHRNAFIQNIAMDIAVAVIDSTSKTFRDNAENYIKSNPTFLTMLTEYFSSDEFQASQEQAEYPRAYTACLNNDIFNKTADILGLGFSTILPDGASTIQYAYQQSTPYKNELKTNLLESYTKKHGIEPKDTFNDSSEMNKSYYDHRNQFIQNITLEIAVAVRLSTSTNFRDNVENYIKRNPTFLNMLIEYFSSDEFKASQEQAEYRRAYTVCLSNEIFNKSADLLGLDFSTKLPNGASTIQYAYQQSTHYQSAKDSQNLENGSEGKVYHADFGRANLFEHPVRKEGTFLNASNNAIPQHCSIFTNSNEHTQTKESKCTIM